MDCCFCISDKAAGFVTIEGVKWAKPLFTRADVNDAARILLAPSPDHADVDQALSAVNNWRAIHAYPLQAVKMTLSNRAKHVERAALIAQRTKRIPAIVLKLQENHAAGLDMQLTQMHDIGGCRAILRSVGQVEQLVKVYAEATAKNALRGGKFHRKYDYIASPKPSGYRSVHLVYKYFTTTETHSVYNDLKIEIQIRSKLQHAWATAVETVDFFTGQALKSNIGEASWKRFFALVSNEFARLEKRPLVPGVPQTEAECKRELKSCSTQIGLLEGLTAATGFVEHKEGQLFLLELDLQNKTVTTTGFPREKALEAQDKYLEVERANRGNPNKQAVLVSVDSLAALPKAYPNFYLDISEFITVLRKVLA